MLEPLVIQAQNVSKTFKVHLKAPGLKGSLKALFRRSWQTKQALKEISLSVKAGEIVGLLGANGAGKTTLVKILAGILYPNSGHVRVLDHDPWQRKDEFRRQISLIMGQKQQLWWDLPAADCFLLLREIYRIPPTAYQRDLEYLAETLGVTNLLTTQIRRLSLGERMKMELIAALLHQPRIVFLDEPTIGLDITAQRAIRSFILQYRQTHNPAMILTSHYMEDIRNLCKRIVILRKGEVVYDGLLSHVIDEFATAKIVSARLDPDRITEVASLEISGKRGEVLESTPELFRVKVPKDRAMECSRGILERLPVVDLNIEDEDVGSIIEAIQRAE